VLAILWSFNDDFIRQIKRTKAACVLQVGHDAQNGGRKICWSHWDCLYLGAENNL
jgi:hypothetical protein